MTQAQVAVQIAQQDVLPAGVTPGAFQVALKNVTSGAVVQTQSFDEAGIVTPISFTLTDYADYVVIVTRVATDGTTVIGNPVQSAQFTFAAPVTPAPTETPAPTPAPLSAVAVPTVVTVTLA